MAPTFPQVNGIATVNAIDPCPPIAGGEGSVVTARFITRQVDEIVTLTVTDCEGRTETLQGTPIHPIWSVDREDWVAMGEIAEGETLQGERGLSTATAVTLRKRSVPVYNIEVHGEHVYQIGKLGVLVHNVYSGDLGDAVGRGMHVITGPTMADYMVDIAARLGNARTREQVREIIHRAKDKMNIGPAEDLGVDLSGGLWDTRTGEYISKIWESI